MLGTGTCIGKVPLSHRHLCNVTYESPRTKLTYYLSPGPNKWWACSTGLTPCVSTSVFNDIRDYCILVQLVPRVIYHPSETSVDEFDRWLTRLRREPGTMTLTPVYFIWTTLRRKLGQLGGSARGKLLTNNEDSDTSHHPVVLGFSLSLSLSLSLFLSLSVSFQAKNSRLVSNLTFLLLPPKLLGSQLHTTEPHSSFSFYKANY